MEYGESVKTLQGHSKGVWRLEQLESGELVSCSSDSIIKIWKIAENTCIRTLIGHNVRSLRISLNNTLVSCSYDGILKTWNFKTGECLNTNVVENGIYLEDFIFI